MGHHQAACFLPGAGGGPASPWPCPWQVSLHSSSYSECQVAGGEQAGGTVTWVCLQVAGQGRPLETRCAGCDRRSEMGTHRLAGVVFVSTEQTQGLTASCCCPGLRHRLPDFTQRLQGGFGVCKMRWLEVTPAPGTVSGEAAKTPMGALEDQSPSCQTLLVTSLGGDAILRPPQASGSSAPWGPAG